MIDMRFGGFAAWYQRQRGRHVSMVNMFDWFPGWESPGNNQYADHDPGDEDRSER